MKRLQKFKIVNAGKKGQKGFTLVEIMIALAIIALMTGVGMKAYTASKANSDGSIVSENFKGILSAVAQWELTRGSFTGLSCNELIAKNLLVSGLSSCTGTAPNQGNYTAAVSGRAVTITATAQTDGACASAENYMANMGPNSTVSCSNGTVSLVFNLI